MISSGFAITRSSLTPIINSNAVSTPSTNAMVSDTSALKIKPTTTTATMSDIDILKKEIAALKGELASVKKDVSVLKFIVTSLDKVVTALKKAFESHAHWLNGYTSEWISTVKGWNANLIYLHVSNKLTQEKKDKLKQTGKPITQ